MRNVPIFSVKQVTRPAGRWKFPMRKHLDEKERTIQVAKLGLVLHEVVKPDDKEAEDDGALAEGEDAHAKSQDRYHADGRSAAW